MKTYAMLLASPPFPARGRRAVMTTMHLPEQGHVPFPLAAPPSFPAAFVLDTDNNK